jgi:hypothetical protein
MLQRESDQNRISFYGIDSALATSTADRVWPCVQIMDKLEAAGYVDPQSASTDS